MRSLNHHKMGIATTLAIIYLIQGTSAAMADGNGTRLQGERDFKKIQMHIETGKGLTEIMKNVKDTLTDRMSSDIDDLEKGIVKIDTTFSGLRDDERLYIEDARTLLRKSGTTLFLLRQTLTILAKETISRSNRVIKVLKMVEKKPDKAYKLIRYFQKKMNQLFARSKDILKTLNEYPGIIKNIRQSKIKLENFIQSVEGLGNEQNERFEQWKRELREKVYGSDSSCGAEASPSCAENYPSANAVINIRINSSKEAIERMTNATKIAIINAGHLKKKVDEKEKDVVSLIALVNKWSLEVSQNTEGYASSEDILKFVETLGPKTAISMLCGLTNACKDYIDQNLLGLEKNEIESQPLHSACSVSGK